MGPIWGRQDPGGPHVGPMNFAIWVNDSVNNNVMSSVQRRCNGMVMLSLRYVSDGQQSINSLRPSDAYMRQ